MNFYGCLTALHHNSTTNKCVHVRSYTRTSSTHARVGALVFSSSCLDESITRVGPSQYPQYTCADYGQEAVGRSTTERHHEHYQCAHNNIPRETKVSHGSGVMDCETMAMETVTMNRTEETASGTPDHSSRRSPLSCRRSSRRW